MARLNGKRRRAAAQRRAATLFAKSLNPATQAETGSVRSSTGKAKQGHANQVVPAVARAYAPKPFQWEGQGKRKRVKPPKPRDASTAHVDSTRAHLLRAWADGRPKKPQEEH